MGFGSGVRSENRTSSLMKELILVPLSVEDGNVPSRPLEIYLHGLTLVRDEQKRPGARGCLTRNSRLYSHLEWMGKPARSRVKSPKRRKNNCEYSGD